MIKSVKEHMLSFVRQQLIFFCIFNKLFRSFTITWK